MGAVEYFVALRDSEEENMFKRNTKVHVIEATDIAGKKFREDVESRGCAVERERRLALVSNIFR